MISLSHCANGVNQGINYVAVSDLQLLHVCDLSACDQLCLNCSPVATKRKLK